VLLAMFGFATYPINIRRIPAVFTTVQSLFALIVLGSLPLTPLYLAESVLYKTVSFNLRTVMVVIALYHFVGALMIGFGMWLVLRG
jgi:hypothetical protein